MSAPLRPVVAGRVALEAVLAATAEAEASDIRLSIVVIDRGGVPVASVRSEDALPVTTDLALAKARAAVGFARPSASLAGIVQPGEPFFGLASAVTVPIATFAGGLPLLEGDVCFGAVGVSGGTGEQDVSAAETVVTAIARGGAGGASR